MDDKQTLMKILYKASPKLRKALLADPTTVKILSEYALNILKGKIPLKKKHKENLRRHRKKVHLLSKKSTPIAKKEKILQQGGCFFNKFVESVVEDIAESIGDALMSAIL